MRSLIAAAVVVAATAAVASQARKVTSHGLTTCHTYDPAKLTIVERKLSDRQGSTGEAVVWRILTDYGLVVGDLATKQEADEALAAAKKFTSMCLIGRSPHSFTYFER